LANGVAQRYWSFVVELCTDPEPSVRLKALHLAEVVLRQGLVHPMSCFPPLIALQADPVLTVRKLAMRLLRQQHGKYPDFFDHQLGAGLGLLFEFCKRLQAAARRAARGERRGGGQPGIHQHLQARERHALDAVQVSAGSVAAVRG
jgi:cohesin loading factor subunit SCC2